MERKQTEIVSSILQEEELQKEKNETNAAADLITNAATDFVRK